MILVIYAIITLHPALFDTDSPEKVLATVELAYARMMIIVGALFAYPIVLFSSLKYTKHVIIEYPKGVLVSAVLLLRPLLIICLIWMSFELTYSKSKVE
jgi:hypothetical protein